MTSFGPMVFPPIVIVDLGLSSSVIAKAYMPFVLIVVSTVISHVD